MLGTMYEISFRFIPGHSPIDHLHHELITVADCRLKANYYASPIRAHKEGLRALMGARIYLRRLATESPSHYGVFVHTLPRVEVVITKVPSIMGPSLHLRPANMS